MQTLDLCDLVSHLRLTLIERRARNDVPFLAHID